MTEQATAKPSAMTIQVDHHPTRENLEIIKICPGRGRMAGRCCPLGTEIPALTGGFGS
ncbi:hypothetical protein AB0N62_08450 [Streptomyces sp. NPDC093982]|uniref:hypothetical protein n=1 Tax=Streptomyces sp. NPDC093982 TaxID=3155077 RepID=UPI003425F930